MKQQFRFYFADEPQFACAMSRAELANKLRSYRAKPEFNLTHYAVRKGANRYEIRLRLSDAVGIVEPI